jgi:chemotaxis protein MotB
MARGAKREKKPDEGAPGWMVTFADLMTLLLTFFVLLLSMSTLDNQKVKLALGSLRGALGVLQGGGQPREGRKEISSMPRIAQGEMKIMTTLERVVEKQSDRVSNDMIQIGHKDEKVFVAIDDSMLFAPGSTEILPSAYPFLDDLSAAMTDSTAVAEFIGHADDTAPSGYYESNWEVAAARALAVLIYVQRAGPIEGHRLKASSHGEFLPRYENDSAAGRARNRRVEIIFTVTSASDRYFYGEERMVRDVLPAPEGAGAQ